jgi:Ca-activated chloride channel family protein
LSQYQLAVHSRGVGKSEDGLGRKAWALRALAKPVAPKMADCQIPKHILSVVGHAESTSYQVRPLIRQRTTPMTNSNQNHDPATIANFDDHLMDRALAEVVGGDVPPDLSERILATRSAKPTDDRRTVLAWSKPLVAVAALLLVAGTIALLLSGSPFKPARYRESSAKLDRSSRILREHSSSLNEQIAINDAHAPPSGEVANGPWESSQSSGQYMRSMSKPRVFYDTLVDGKRVETNEETVVVPYTKATESPAGGRSKDGSQWRTFMDLDSRTIPGERLSIEATPGSGEVIPSFQGREGTTFGFRRKKFASVDLDASRPGLQLGITPRIIIEEQAEERLSLAEEAGKETNLGTGPGSPGDQYTRIYENPFVKAMGGDAVSTFSIDVDTASYANVRQFLRDLRQLPPPDAVRIEELVNYFQYSYEPPTPPAPGSAGGNVADSTPFAAHVEVAACPWAPEHRLVRIGVKGREIERDKRPPSNLVFLIDVSGSMSEPNKLPLVIDGLRQLTRELGENDRVAIVVYASSEGLALASTRGDQQQTILETLSRLRAGGSTAGGAGIQLAYQIAEDHFIPGGANRVVLCTDGDFNVGVTSTAELERLVAQKAKDTKVFLSVLGFGRGNLNDAMMQTIADRGNGNHHYVDSLREARKVLVEELTGTLVTIAKDVKLQVEFNPAQVSAYRLIGYENRMLRTEDFNDDTKDAGEIGAGHTVTALYEVIPASVPTSAPAADELKYQQAEIRRGEAATTAIGRELLTLKMRYKEPESDMSRKLEWSVTDAEASFPDASDDFQFAAAVAEFGLLLGDSEFKGAASFDEAAEIAAANLGADPHGYRSEFVELIRRAKGLREQTER